MVFLNNELLLESNEINADTIEILFEWSEGQTRKLGGYSGGLE